MYKERVLIVHNYYQIPGGEDIVVANEKKMLEDNGHKVFMYTRHNDEINKKGVLGKLLLPFETIYSLKTKKEIKKIIKKNKIDIVHVHNTFPLISPSIYKASKKSGAKVVQTVHNFRLLCPAATFVNNGEICEECVNKGLMKAIKYGCYRNSKLQTIISVLMLKFNRIIGSYNKVDFYITLNEFNKKKLTRLVPREKIFVKPNFCEILNIKKVPLKQRDYFIFLGRLDRVKGINLLIEAWKDIKDEELIVVGIGPEEEYIKKFIKENNIKNIKLLGYKNKDEAMSLLSKSKALIFPVQWYEPFGLVLIEALKLGVPIIANDIGGVSEIINNKKVGIVGLIENEKDIKQLLKKFFRNYDKYYEIEQYFKDEYSAKKNYEILKRIYSYLKIY